MPDQWLTGVLGPHSVVADRSWPHGDARVLQICDARGVTWFAKYHREPNSYRKELTAYRRWVPALGRHAPRLRGHDDERMALVLSSVPGDAGTEDAATPAVQHQAGRLLRRLHDAQPPRPWPEFAGEQRAKLDKWLARGTELLDRHSIDFVTGQVDSLAGLIPDVVPCHLDYTPRNWLIADGTLFVIDFERCATHVWYQDLSRLYFGLWRRDPAARDAFLDGYGRVPTGDELAVLRALGAAAALTTVVWAHRHGDTAYEAEGRRNLAAFVAATMG